MLGKIYLIGKVNENIDESCKRKFFKTQLLLLDMGFNVINPIKNLCNADYSFDEAKRKNFEELLSCNSAYIMPCVSFENGIINTEIKVALDFNITIINGFVDFSEE